MRKQGRRQFHRQGRRVSRLQRRLRLAERLCWNHRPQSISQHAVQGSSSAHGRPGVAWEASQARRGPSPKAHVPQAHGPPKQSVPSAAWEAGPGQLCLQHGGAPSAPLFILKFI